MTFQKGHGRLRSQESYKTQDYSFMTPEYCQRMSEIAKEKGYGKWMTGKQLSVETKEKISRSNKGKNAGEKNYAFGRVFSEETRLKMSKAHQGEKCHLWKGGISPENKIIRSTYEYDHWRRLVFERDKYTCQKCNKSGVYLHAHHLKSFAEYPELRFDINNGETLCKDCHELTDNFKGRSKKMVEALYPIKIIES